MPIIISLSILQPTCTIAVRQMGFMDKAWPELDNAIALHMNSFFLGRPPASGYNNRLRLTMGVSAQHIASIGKGLTPSSLAPQKRMENMLGPQISANRKLANFRLFFEGTLTMDKCVLSLKSRLSKPPGRQLCTTKHSPSK